MPPPLLKWGHCLKLGKCRCPVRPQPLLVAVQLTTGFSSWRPSAVWCTLSDPSYRTHLLPWRRLQEDHQRTGGLQRCPASGQCRRDVQCKLRPVRCCLWPLVIDWILTCERDAEYKVLDSQICSWVQARSRSYPATEGYLITTHCSTLSWNHSLVFSLVSVDVITVTSSTSLPSLALDG